MATTDVVRDVGDTLVYLLRAGIPAAIVDPANIFVATLDQFDKLHTPAKPTISIFLYSIAVNAETRNGPRRTRPDGSTTRPLLPLQLGYLITPWAKEARDEYRIVGRILQVFYDHAELGPADLQGSSWSPEDSVQLILESLPPEEHYRIWDTTDLPYRLSLTYLARVIGIEPGESVAAVPVLQAIFEGAP
jgi:hypothetical protein